MGFNAGELTAYIDLDDTKFERKLDRDRDELGRFVGKKHTTTLDVDTAAATTKLGALSNLVMSNSQKVQSAGMKMSVASLAYAAGAVVAVNSASSLNEAQNKVNAVFGESSDAVLDWGENAADAIGQSERQALSAAGTFGNLFVSMGMADQKSADMSITLTNLASDLASFNDIDPAEALDALRSGLVGETEPMRRLGVNMNEATLRAKALELGLDATGATLDPLVKAQSAYALIMEQTATAQGDFARTGDEVANSSRAVKAEAEDLAAAWGQELLPVVKDVLGVAKPVLGFFSELPGPVKLTAIALGGLFAVIGPSLWMLGGMAEGLKTVKSAWSAIRTAFTTADSAAIAANTAAVEANTAARIANAGAPAVGAAGTAATAAGTAATSAATAGAVGTGAWGLGVPVAAGGLGVAGVAAGAAVPVAIVASAVLLTRDLNNEPGMVKRRDVDPETGRDKVGTRRYSRGGTNDPSVEADRQEERRESLALRGALHDSIMSSHTASDAELAGAEATDENTNAIDSLTGAVDANTEATKAQLKESILSDASSVFDAVASATAAGIRLTAAELQSVSEATLPKAVKNQYKSGIDWAQVPDRVTGYASGGEFVTHGPELILVGDNPSGIEHVSVTPGEAMGKGGGVVNRFDFRGAKFGPGLTRRDVEDVLTDRVVPRLLDVLAVS